MNARVPVDETDALEAQSELLEVLRASVYPRAGAEALRLVLAYCKAMDVDPLQKPVHLVAEPDAAYAGEWRLLPGIGLYRTIAARSGCAGTSEPEFGPDVSGTVGGVATTYPAWCRVSVRRRLPTGEIAEFTAKEFWRENYAPLGPAAEALGLDPASPNVMWSKRPYGQLAKCAEAQALRKAFPEIGAQPAAEEMEGKNLEEDTLLASRSPPRVPSTRRPAVAMPRAKDPERTLSAVPVQSAATDSAVGGQDADGSPAGEAPAGAVPVDASAVGAHDTDDTRPATGGEIAYLLRRIGRRSLTVEAARTAAGLGPGSTLEGLTRAGFAALKEALA